MAQHKGEKICQANFADEPSFWLHGGIVRLWTKPGETIHRLTVKNSAKVHVWAAFSSMGTFPLCIFTQNLTGDPFVKILEWHLIDQGETLHGNRRFRCKTTIPSILVRSSGHGWTVIKKESI